MNMEPQNRFNTAQAAGREIDLGLQSYMQKVYNTMGLGLAITGIVAFAVAHTPALMALIFGTPLKWAILFAPLAVVWFGLSPARVYNMPSGKVKAWFIALSVIYGLTFASIFHIFTAESIARVFFITSATFAGMSLFGYTTKKDLSKMGSFLFMGLMGIIVASIVNIFLGSSMIQFIVSVAGVIIFTGLTAYETQEIKQRYALSHGDETNSKMATMGALSLYLNFIMLFQSLLNLMGERE